MGDINYSIPCHLGNALGDVGIVHLASETLGSITHGKYGHIGRGVRPYGPAHHRNAIEYSYRQSRDRFVAIVEALGHLHILVTLKRTLILTTQGLLIALAQCYGVPETEVVLQNFLHLFPSNIVLALVTHAVDNAREACLAHLLRLEGTKVQSIGSVAQSKAARLMVGSDDDECLLGMLPVELVGLK